MTCLRHWTQLAAVVNSGHPGPRQESIRGAEADRAAFIAAMHRVSAPMADGLVARLGGLDFHHLLDVGGASGTWTLAFLRAGPAATATIFDLPDAIAQARTRLAGHELCRPRPAGGRRFLCRRIARRGRSRLGQCHRPSALASAQPRSFTPRSIGRLQPGGRIAIRDMVMDGTAPVRPTARCSPSTCWSTRRAAAPLPLPSLPRTFRRRALLIPFCWSRARRRWP